MNTAKTGLSAGEKTSLWFYHKITKHSRKWFTHVFLVLVVVAYSLLGGFAFHYIEGKVEEKNDLDLIYQRRVALHQIRQMTQDMGPLNSTENQKIWLGKAANIIQKYENVLTSYFGIDYSQFEEIGSRQKWDYWGSVFYCGTIYTTIGYGHITPTTTTGRFLTIIYAVFGIPMFLILLADFGKMFTRGIKWAWAFVRRLYYTGTCKKVRKTEKVLGVMKGVQVVYDIATFRRGSGAPGKSQTSQDNGEVHTPGQSGAGEEPQTPVPTQFAIDDEFNLPITVALTILLLYIFGGAVIINLWEEGWTFFESFYFVFISMSTIGFGDFVPQNKMYMMASIVYLAFGLALTSMCINVVQEKLSDTFRKATAKIGATIGLRVYQDDGAVTPVAPEKIELAQIHRAA